MLVTMNPIHSITKKKKEDTNQLFLKCQFSRDIWEKISRKLSNTIIHMRILLIGWKIYEILIERTRTKSF